VPDARSRQRGIWYGVADPYVTAAILIGAIAGLLPAIRAAQLSPTEALRTV
jgi:ABC-type antimicrobial peptide transport system permease subunit